MTDFILVHSDKAIFLPNFGAAIVVVRPGLLKGSGPMFVAGKKACVEGDESGVSVPGCVYNTPQYSAPGSGTLKIVSLAGDQKTKKSRTGGKALLLKGGSFTAKFEVQTPAMQPPPGPGAPIPDPMRQYSGRGSFLSINMTVRAG
jgi:hypothetical protein